MLKIKIAIISLTEPGKKLAEIISKELIIDPRIVKVDNFHKNVKINLKSVFKHYDCIIGVMATGIMVRNICGMIKSKDIDPAILVVDEKGGHIISLLSGHLGGANEISKAIAAITGGEAVITTSTDINHKFGVDCLARRYYFNITDPSKIKSINTSLISNDPVYIAVNPKFEFIWEDVDIVNSYNRISEKSDNITVSNSKVTMDLKPRKIVVGIGSRKDIKSESVIHAVKSSLKILNLPVARINALATGEMKKNESGIIDASFKLGLPLEVIPDQTLKRYENPDLTYSDFVMDKFGVGGVCEPSALIAAGHGSRLIFRKTIYNGVTVAVSAAEN